MDVADHEYTITVKTYVIFKMNYYYSDIVRVCSGSLVCSGNVVVTACVFESGRPGSSPEWGQIYYKASITAQGLPEPSSLWGI